MNREHHASGCIVRHKSLSENSVECRFGGKSQAVFSFKTLRAAGLLPEAGVGSRPHSPFRGCSLARPARTLAALATAKIPRRGTLRNFQTGSKTFHAGPSCHAFTLVELLVTIAILGILASLIVPVLAKGRMRVQGSACLNNLKQLQTCWLMYAQDNNDLLPVNESYHDGGVWRSTTNSWIGDSSALVDRDAKTMENGLLFKYNYNRDVKIYHCPADKAVLKNDSSRPRLRSYSLQSRLGSAGTNDLHRLAEIREPGPEEVFVFVDEHEDSIDDAHFLVWYAPDKRWVNMPASRHNQGATFSFADGHGELWKWKAPKNFAGRTDYYKTASSAGDLDDLRRLQRANPRNRDGIEVVP
jgi:prepilin-type N-terminal cleavage/methylation domain-containing protein/prepilin-type processing-associated H-X9-DG protein